MEKFIFSPSFAYITVPPPLCSALENAGNCLYPGMLVSGRLSGETPCSVKKKRRGAYLCSSRARLCVLYSDLGC